jgi:hypothetical protein
MCPKCGDPIRWHIVGGLENPVPWQVWHDITEGRFKPSDLFDFDHRRIRTSVHVAPRQDATRIRPA